MEGRIKRRDLKYETNRYEFDFQQFETLKPFGDGKISIDEADIEQTNLLENIVNFSNKSRPRSKRDKYKKQNTFDSTNALYEGRELILNTFRSRIFLIKNARRMIKLLIKCFKDYRLH